MKRRAQSITPRRPPGPMSDAELELHLSRMVRKAERAGEVKLATWALAELAMMRRTASAARVTEVDLSARRVRAMLARRVELARARLGAWPRAPSPELPDFADEPELPRTAEDWEEMARSARINVVQWLSAATEYHLMAVALWESGEREAPENARAALAEIDARARAAKGRVGQIR